MTKNELIKNIDDSYKKMCKNHDAFCSRCPYIGYYNCEMVFAISYLNKRHLIKGLEREDNNEA